MTYLIRSPDGLESHFRGLAEVGVAANVDCLDPGAKLDLLVVVHPDGLQLQVNMEAVGSFLRRRLSSGGLELCLRVESGMQLKDLMEMIKVSLRVRGEEPTAADNARSLDTVNREFHAVIEKLVGHRR